MGEPTVQKGSGREIAYILAAKLPVEQKRETITAQGELKPTYGTKLKKTKAEPGVKKECQPETDGSQIQKRHPKKLPLAYCSLFVMRLMKLDDELSKEELFIADYVFAQSEELDGM